MLLFLLTLMQLSSTSVASETPLFFETIYGEDDRTDLIEESDLKLSRAIAVGLTGRYTHQLPKISAQSLEKVHRVCSDVAFSQQPAIADCTAVHIGQGLMLTAQHCVKNQYDCDKFQWAFDYHLDFIGDNRLEFELPEVYRCEKVVTSNEELDISIFQLKAKKLNRPAMKLHLDSPLTEKVFAIGSPLGLPLKNSGLGQVRKKDDIWAVASLDVFHGNSGSPIFNTQNQAIGILVSGGPDFIFEGECKRNYVMTSDKSSIEHIVLYQGFPQAFKFLIQKVQKRLR